MPGVEYLKQLDEFLMYDETSDLPPAKLAKKYETPIVASAYNFIWRWYRIFQRSVRVLLNFATKKEYDTVRQELFRYIDEENNYEEAKKIFEREISSKIVE